MLADNHFYKQFDRYDEGQPRLEAACRHLSWVINHSSKIEDRLIQDMNAVLQKLRDGQTVAAALYLDECLRNRSN